MSNEVTLVVRVAMSLLTSATVRENRETEPTRETVRKNGKRPLNNIVVLILPSHTPTALYTSENSSNRMSLVKQAE